MPTLTNDLRNRLERAVIDARDVAEAAALAALEAVAVHYHEPYPHQTAEQRKLRNHLRARARHLGDTQNARGELSIDHLVHECGYEHWHRMLFARFLAENDLLIEPSSGVAISLQECEELAKEAKIDLWTYASRCAQGMLPRIFRPDDPLLQVSFATEHRIKLERLLDALPHAVFTASDALGWVYQFWQSKKKDEVNRSEVKIGADELPAVTQLFTEPYMVEFLLHNTLGAWWAGRKLTADDLRNATSEEELRRKIALPGVNWEYLRFVRDTSGSWRPAAGTFDGWPKTIRQLKLLDPCCGSGHFLVAALYILVAIRMAEEGLSAREAIDAVLRDNLHGLEIDERCCQIAAFALAFAAWTYPDAGGYRPLPDLHIACTGIGPQSTKEQWVKLAEQSGMPTRPDERERIKNGLLNLHWLFSQAPTLGSLINPAELRADLLTAGYQTIQPYLAAVLSAEKADDETRERAIAAAGMVKAADLLADEYILVITNVPYLGRGKQGEVLKGHLQTHYPLAKADLAAAFVLRCLESCAPGGSTALVTPQNWLFLTTYTKLRQLLIEKRSWNAVVRLGPGAFETISGHVVNVALSMLSATPPADGHTIAGIDVSAAKEPEEKAAILRGEKSAEIVLVKQAIQLENPDTKILISEIDRPNELLSVYADSFQGLMFKDRVRLIKYYWEIVDYLDYKFMQSSFRQSCLYSGKQLILNWTCFEKNYKELGGNYKWNSSWGKKGVGISQMGSLPRTIFLGNQFDGNIDVIIPKTESYLPAIWEFVLNDHYVTLLRHIDSKLDVNTASLIQVPFDFHHWQKVAAEKYPNGLPQPESDDPTQWLFHGRPEESTAPLHAAVARLLGYRWPAELDDQMRLSTRARALVRRCDELAEFADDDGIVCIPSVRGEEPAADRLLSLLDACGIKPDKMRELAGGADLDEWLRNSFFEEHCKLFHDRPFVWHIWDGRKRDGFHALVNYHKLCEGGGKGRKLLESLTYSYLGDWIARQQDGVKRGEAGAEDRLAAGMELQKRLIAILEGEPPFDLFVRWKTLHEQSIGWEPDINDGVRLNIRPFLANDLPTGRAGAGVLRWKPNVKWEKDRGREPQRPKSDFPWFWGWDGKALDFMGGKEFTGERFNGCHYTVAAKRRAREVAKNGGK